MKNLSFKVDIRATVIATLLLVLSVGIMHVVPTLAIIILPFITIPGTILWYRSKPSFFVAVVITLCATVLLGNVYLLTTMTLIIFMSVFVGQLLIERTSKERTLYLVTTFMSILTICSVLILQVTGHLQTTTKLFSQLQDGVSSQIQMSGMVMPEYEAALQQVVNFMQVIVPGFIVISILLFVLVNLLVTFPILRKFKVVTPVFRPLFMWQINRSVATIFVLAILAGFFVKEENVVAYGIVINLQFVLEWVIFIQALSLFHLYVKVKKLPVVVGILIFVFAFIFNKYAYLFGLMDIWFNLKQRIKK
ncbi:DUF2232 domain-containing protein [Mammaliicoccus sp. Dog046]|uniref:DUF2232 domain-containing protein n=1 Tax=Mammaliicoccus sp. Dog046 TaxID=3034233 RepID=UPI002B25C57C|nr:DUF2232 domain-containing protein [Mammaliicoccus sp. Dog046]WQK86668.1 DUF2232 domain-containing protein [Mammaliicoccus sp. Dog046]